MITGAAAAFTGSIVSVFPSTWSATEAMLPCLRAQSTSAASDR